MRINNQIVHGDQTTHEDNFYLNADARSVCSTELTMGHGSNGSTNLGGSRDLLTHD